MIKIDLAIPPGTARWPGARENLQKPTDSYRSPTDFGTPFTGWAQGDQFFITQNNVIVTPLARQSSFAARPLSIESSDPRPLALRPPPSRAPLARFPNSATPLAHSLPRSPALRPRPGPPREGSRVEVWSSPVRLRSQ